MYPKVSLLIPSYNYDRFLQRCLESALKQTYENVEVVVSDDCSTDASREILARYAGRATVRVLMQNERLGMVGNWNACVRGSAGDFFILLGADDFLHPDMVKRSVGAIGTDPHVQFSHCAAAFVDDSGEVLSRTGTFTKAYVKEGHQLLEAFLKGKRVVNTSGMVRRSAFDAVGGWDTRYRNCMDQDLWFRLMLRGKVAYVPEILVYFRSHDVSESWKVMQASEDLSFLIHCFDRLPPQSHRLRRLQTAAVQKLVDAWLPVLLRLPSDEARNATIVRLVEHRFGGPGSARQSAWQTGKQIAGLLPRPLKYIVGSLYDRIR